MQTLKNLLNTQGKEPSNLNASRESGTSKVDALALTLDLGATEDEGM
jgi:hypothetical protein